MFIDLVVEARVSGAQIPSCKLIIPKRSIFVCDAAFCVFVERLHHYDKLPGRAQAQAVDLRNASLDTPLLSSALSHLFHNPRRQRS